ncbi:hypothetical protein HJC23_012272 [Cyclotella cryptica]|uniref:Sidoreflexin n=1 Tax=Cyclotella cryptica TaxID=29204 RepID=A0ABD3P9J8_9STRA|eukprot:CCRYP_016793-RA/>CCRYP_016793-RA protein AED:0.04 eAED:0.04 QI:278/1/1/1/1/1/3/158/440
MNIAQIAKSSLRCGTSLVRRKGSSAFPRSHDVATPIRIRYKTTVTANSTAAKPSAGTTRSKVNAATSETASSSSGGVPIGTTLVAMSLAIATVGGVAAIAERSTASAIPKFDPKSQRFDQSTFMGRLSKMLLACDPFLLAYSHEEVMRCKDLVEGYEKLYQELPDGTSEKELSRKLWEAQRVASAALHPDTGDSIPHPFRMSGYVPFNGPICVAMVASQSTSALLFWSWMNQSQNALVNYYNRNASSPMTNETLLKSYSAAVGSALTVAFGLATFIQRRFPPQQAKNLLRWVAFPSSVVASSLNCYIVRSPEIGTGITLVDANGNDVLPGETSKIAAERGVYLTTMSRAVLQAPVFFLPPFLMSSIPLLVNAVANNPMLRVPISTYLLLVCFGIGLPASVAIFPQMGEIRVEEAEEKYHKVPNENNGGKPYVSLFYNKGL